MINQKRKEKVCGKLLEVFGILAESERLRFIIDKTVKIQNSLGETLLEINPKEIITPVTDISNSVFEDESPLTDNFVTNENLLKLIGSLNEKKVIEHLNHVGFCYKISSQTEELSRIRAVINKTSCHLYEMESNDQAKWYFVGYKNNWQDPLIELLPVPPNKDKFKDYWLPHIQIDIDTHLSADEIEKLIKNIFEKSRIPIRLGDKRNTYCVRLRLGVIAGVNIQLDIATSARKVAYSRKYLLKTLI